MGVPPISLLMVLACAAKMAAAVHRPELPTWRSGPRAGSGRALLGAVAAGGSDAGRRCPQLSKEVLLQSAKDNTVMLAVVSTAPAACSVPLNQHAGPAGRQCEAEVQSFDLWRLL